jgi:hypothetical protein
MVLCPAMLVASPDKETRRNGDGQTWEGLALGVFRFLPLIPGYQDHSSSHTGIGDEASTGDRSDGVIICFGKIAHVWG